MAWNGIALTGIWQTKKIDGYVPDFQLLPVPNNENRAKLFVGLVLDTSWTSSFTKGESTMLSYDIELTESISNAKYVLAAMVEGFKEIQQLERPLKFEEFEDVMGSTIYTSATPGPYEMEKAEQVVEQIIRPTGLVDPEVEVRKTLGQVDDLVGEIKQRVERSERVLVTTLTKRMSEDLSEYLQELGMKVQYLHSEVDTLERVGILRDLRMGVFDVLVGINLLREGLDLPEVSLVAILDADKEGFLRSGTALIQTIGRAARHSEGRVIMYADKMTDSMKRAIDETNRRRAKQKKYNTDNGIVPVSIHKAIHDLTEEMGPRAVAEMRGEYKVKDAGGLPRKELQKIIADMDKQMKEAAKNLEFEKAAALRDEIYDLKNLLAEDESLKPWERIKLLMGDDE